MHLPWIAIFVVIFFVFGGEHGLRLIGLGVKLCVKAFEWVFMSDGFRRYIGIGALLLIVGLTITAVHAAETADLTNTTCDILTDASPQDVDPTRHFDNVQELDFPERCVNSGVASLFCAGAALSVTENAYTLDQYTADLATAQPDQLPGNVVAMLRGTNKCN